MIRAHHRLEKQEEKVEEEEEAWRQEGSIHFVLRERRKKAITDKWARSQCYYSDIPLPSSSPPPPHPPPPPLPSPLFYSQASAGSLDYSHIIHSTELDTRERRNSTDGKNSLKRVDGGGNGRRRSLERRSSSGDRNSATPDSFSPTSHSPASTPTSTKG